MWSCCSTPRKTTFWFENGTGVVASDRFRAIELLKSINLKKGPELSSIGEGLWMVTFSKNAFIKVEAPGSTQARQTAEWLVYLDRRSLRIV